MRHCTLYSYNLLDLAITANNHAKLAARAAGKETGSHAIRKQLVSGIIAVHKADDLLGCHAGRRVAFAFAQVLLLLGAPGVDVLCVFRVYMYKDVKEVREGIVLCQLLVDMQQVLQLVLLQRAARGFPAGLDFGGGNGAEANGPPLENDDVYGWVAGLVDGDPLRFW